MKPMILVTGGCGYIGSHVVKALGDVGESVVVFDNLSQGSADSLLLGEQLVVGDIRDKTKLEEVFANHGIETVIHLSALVNATESVTKAIEYQQVNELGSKNVWELAKKYNVKHCLYASSAAVYGNINTRVAISEDYPTSPSNPYGETKLAGEQSLQELMSTEVGNYLIFRFFNVGGAGDTGKLGQSLASRAIMQRLYHAALSGQEVTISGADYDTIDGTVMRDFVHVEDIVRAMTLGLEYLRKNGKSDVLNLGSGTVHSVKQVINEVEKSAGKSLNIVYGPPNPGDITYSLADINRARQVLGWEPKKSFAEIISSGYHSYRSRYV
jgi:UDP-glucose 4-epimerase